MAKIIDKVLPVEKLELVSGVDKPWEKVELEFLDKHGVRRVTFQGTNKDAELLRMMMFLCPLGIRSLY
jgi:hypothetical protein